jgi:peptidoglycan/LPS O-acetylase OafA/YrhL
MLSSSISGYLISRSLFKGLKNGTFSLAGYYELCARRILPALFLVLAISSVFTFLTSRLLLETSRSVIASIDFVAAIVGVGVNG